MTKKITLIDICKALANGEFIFFYQPIISLVSGKISGAEALIRWRRSDGSIISPAEFIPLSIEKGFITEITREMFPKLLADLVEIDSIDNSLKVSFNVTAQDLEQDDFAEFIGENITRQGINPKRLEMEITENVLMPPNPIIKNSIFW